MEDNDLYSAIFYWICQVLIWILLLVAVIVNFLDIEKKYRLLLIAVFFIAYFIYLILELVSSTGKYLCNKKNEEGMYSRMGIFYKTPPEIKFYCECYHIEIRTYRTIEKGIPTTKSIRRKIISYSEEYILPYYSERDVSGLFCLDCDKAYAKKKHYIQLDLKTEINFADAISYMDYEIAKDRFWQRNRFRDEFFKFKETRTIPGLTEHNLIKLNNEKPPLVNFCWFLLFTFLTFSEVYKLYFNSLCVKQKYTIRKLVSTRYDLNQPIYNAFTPRIDLFSKVDNYESNFYNYKDPNYNVQLPTEEEIKEAEKYKNKVPNYKISDVGTIIDDPLYSNNNTNLNEPPPAFASYRGDVPLNPNQINEKGLPPQKLEQS